MKDKYDLISDNSLQCSHFVRCCIVHRHWTSSLGRGITRISHLTPLTRCLLFFSVRLLQLTLDTHWNFEIQPNQKSHYSKMPLTELEIEGYETFKKKITEWEADKGKHPLFILFTGSDDKDGKSWCPDCVQFEAMWAKFGSKPKTGTFIRVKVGNRDFWKDKKCPFRTDKKTSLSSIPTLVRWGTQKKLSDNDIMDPEILHMLVEDD